MNGNRSSSGECPTHMGAIRYREITHLASTDTESILITEERFLEDAVILASQLQCKILSVSCNCILYGLATYDVDSVASTQATKSYFRMLHERYEVTEIIFHMSNRSMDEVGVLLLREAKKCRLKGSIISAGSGREVHDHLRFYGESCELIRLADKPFTHPSQLLLASLDDIPEGYAYIEPCELRHQHIECVDRLLDDLCWIPGTKHLSLFVHDPLDFYVFEKYELSFEGEFHITKDNHYEFRSLLTRELYSGRLSYLESAYGSGDYPAKVYGLRLLDGKLIKLSPFEVKRLSTQFRPEISNAQFREYPKVLECC